jgi:RimJ/RimL family protein N-acetyltransferase
VLSASVSIVGPRMNDVSLTPLDARWNDAVAALVADPDVLRFTRIPEPPPAGFARTWIDSYEQGRTEGAREGFAAVDAAGTFVGLGLAVDIDRPGAEAELGYIVASQARGRGVGTAILRLLTDWAFTELQAKRLSLVIDVENHPSERIAERCGYQREGVMRSIHVKQGLRADAGLWSRLPSDPAVI